MSKLKVIGVPGRVAFTAHNGERISEHKAVTVLDTPWIRRRLEDGDIKLFDEASAKSAEPQQLGIKTARPPAEPVVAKPSPNDKGAQ